MTAVPSKRQGSQAPSSDHTIEWRTHAPTSFSRFGLRPRGRKITPIQGWERPAIDFRGRGLGLVAGPPHRILDGEKRLRRGIVGKCAATLGSAMRRLKGANTTILDLSFPGDGVVSIKP